MANSIYPEPNRREFPKFVNRLAISFFSRLLFIIELGAAPWGTELPLGGQSFLGIVSFLGTELSSSHCTKTQGGSFQEFFLKGRSFEPKKGAAFFLGDFTVTELRNCFLRRPDAQQWAGIERETISVSSEFWSWKVLFD